MHVRCRFAVLSQEGEQFFLEKLFPLSIQVGSNH